jgi:hypothetical protein
MAFQPGFPSYPPAPAHTHVQQVAYPPPAPAPAPTQQRAKLAFARPDGTVLERSANAGATVVHATPATPSTPKPVQFNLAGEFQPSGNTDHIVLSAAFTSAAQYSYPWYAPPPSVDAETAAEVEYGYEWDAFVEFDAYSLYPQEYLYMQWTPFNTVRWLVCSHLSFESTMV